MTEGQVLHGEHEGVHVLRYVGEIRYPLAASLDRFIRDLFEQTPPRGILVDLTEAELIDSTNLGLLARVANQMGQRALPRVTIICDREDINEVLLSMGFDRVFNLLACPSPGAPDVPCQPVPDARFDDNTINETVLDAHRTLMGMNERNRGMFRDVVSLLEGDRGPDSP